MGDRSEVIRAKEDGATETSSLGPVNHEGPRKEGGRCSEEECLLLVVVVPLERGKDG